ncbi:MAG: aminoglycoside phosphotransferase [Actinobacteria bacterium]|nr:MAG: aminoglycoside phosphotransferase [Actinomycetota bacterium]RIK06734.1 MAG: aminoglycoside phosphotransferase [Acidobacteriota bacterium]
MMGHNQLRHSQGGPWVAATAAELLAGATSREAVDPDDGKSGSSFARVTIDGRGYFLKSLSPAGDWIMRITGDYEHRPLLVWQAGIIHSAPACIDPAIVGMALEGDGEHAVLSILMHDIGDRLVPEGDEPIRLAQHRGFVDHLAALSAAYWGWEDTIGLVPLSHRFRFFAPDNIAAELDVDDVPVPIRVADEGWRVLPERSPRLAEVLAGIHDDPSTLTRALEETPATFLHGDWKMGNLGSHPDGRTILLDWAYPGQGPACYDLAWYMALNRSRLPETKEATIEAFRSALERHGVDTGGWWETQLDLCLLGIMATFAWEKAVGDEAELRWWESRALGAIRWLG